MNEQMQSRMLEYLDALESAVQSGSDFVVGQAPLVCREYVDWCFWSAVIQASACGVAIVLLLAFAWWSAVRAFKARDGNSPWWDCLVFSVVLSVLLAIPLILGVLDIVKAKAAPRVLILEKVVALTRQVRQD